MSRTTVQSGYILSINIVATTSEKVQMMERMSRAEDAISRWVRVETLEVLSWKPATALLRTFSQFWYWEPAVPFGRSCAMR
jgi:hypothetical protein